MDAEQIILGSGDLYAIDYDGEIPENEEIEIPANLLGRIKGGASIEYKPAEHTVEDDSGTVSETFVVSEEITFKSGILTWNLSTLAKLVAAGNISDVAGVRTLTLGGRAGRRIKKYLIHFVHLKSDDTHGIRATMVATASNGFTVAFKPDAETVVDAQFKAVSHNNEGNKLILTEDYAVAGG